MFYLSKQENKIKLKILTNSPNLEMVMKRHEKGTFGIGHLYSQQRELNIVVL